MLIRFKGKAVVMAVASTILGLIVLVGWYTESPGLIQLHPSFVPMQYNTALGFIFGGLALLSVAYGAPRSAIVCGAVVAALGILTLFQYVFVVDLGMDQLFMRHDITVKTSHPGRMAPNTAMCFALAGAAFLIYGILGGSRRVFMLMGILGSVVVGLGFVAASGYALGLETAYGWGSSTQMALHTSLGFMVLGGGLFCFSWGAEWAAEDHLPAWFPFPIGIGVLTIVVSLWQAVRVEYRLGLPGEPLSHFLLLLFGGVLAVAMTWAAHLTLRARKSEERYAFAVSGSQDGLWDWNIETDEGYMSPRWLEMLGYKTGEIEAHLSGFTDLLHPDDFEKVADALRSHLENHTPYNLECRLRRKDGEYLWVNARGQARWNKDGKAVQMAGFISDISAAKKAEAQIRASLEEKEVLLKEIHHRVKNNLQVIVSLLSLQAHGEIDPHSLEILSESRRRIMVMARIHQNIYQSDKLSLMNARSYLTELVDDTKESMGANLERISIHVDVDEIILDIDDAIPYGQIISELLSNCLKHAFPDNRPGKIDLSFHRWEGGGVKLTVADNGKGLPEDFDLERIQTLGLKLVASLVRQLGGIITFESAGGTRVHITIPEKES